jgi:hypothetical protein
MQHFFIKKTFLGFVGLMILVSLLGLPAGIDNVGAEGGNKIFLPAVENAIVVGQSSSGVVFGTNATWKYFDKGTSPASNWFAPGYNDSTWASGSAPLGYGNGTERTVVSFGSDSNNKYVTTYFRKTFAIDNAAGISGLSFDLNRDDGAVVYLNGVEVYRTNMPSGTISNSTLASSCAEGTVTKSIDPRGLVNGNNTIAVEVHQCKTSSSDIAFSLSLNVVVSSSCFAAAADCHACSARTTAPTTAPTLGSHRSHCYQPP